MHVYLIAGEESGDFIGARLIDALRQLLNDRITISGIGGEQMLEAGLNRSLFPMQELSLMGFVEILPHIFTLKRRIRETVKDIVKQQPDVIITIDSPGFNFRVVKQLRESKRIHCPIIHYVAPTVWAYKPERAAKTAALYDRLLTILPFEAPYFTDVGLAVNYVGHPSAWYWKERDDGPAFRAAHTIPTDSLVIGVMPGSRMNELKRHLPIFKAAMQHIATQHPAAHIVMPVRPSTAQTVKSLTADWPLPVHVVVGNQEKKQAFAACDVALAKSGTVALETALAEIPTVIAYRANTLTAWMVRKLIRIPHVHLINIMAKREVVPECIQERCTPAIIIKELENLMNYPQARAAQQQIAATFARELGQEDAVSPSEKAAQVIVAAVANLHPESAGSHHTQTDKAVS